MTKRSNFSKTRTKILLYLFDFKVKYPGERITALLQALDYDIVKRNSYGYVNVSVQ